MLTEVMDILFISFFAALNGTYAILIALSVSDIRQRRRSRLPEFDPAVLSDASTPPISIIAPAFNEGSGIVQAVRSFLQLEYPSLGVIVVNDGSTDDTLERLVNAFDLRPTDLVVRDVLGTKPIQVIYQSVSDPRLTVVDKVNGGKADALNVGLNVARSPLVCCLDADTVVDRQALLRLVEPYLYEDELVVAVGGTVRVVNGCTVIGGSMRQTRLPRSWLARFQIVEYLRGFLFGRLGFNKLGGNLIISGAFGLFLRDAVMSAGGYRAQTVGEDMELIVRLHRTLREDGHPYRIVQLHDPQCYTEVPEDAGTLARQRDRWQRGLFDSLWLHRDMMLNPRYGLTGMVVFPVFVFFELLGPVIELAGYAWFAVLGILGQIHPVGALLFFIVAFLLGALLSIQSLVLDDIDNAFYKSARDRLVLLLCAFVEGFGYRQFTLACRIRGLFNALRGNRKWGRMERKGIGQQG